jgi:hypothetical protein
VLNNPKMAKHKLFFRKFELCNGGECIAKHKTSMDSWQITLKLIEM